MSYTTLKTDIENWLDRDDLTSYLDTFIDHAEARFNRVIRHWRMETSDTLDLSSGRTVAAPSDFLEARRVWISAEHPLSYLAPFAFYERYPESTDDDATYYTIEGSNFVFDGAGSDVELLYYAQIPALSGTQDTNWLETYHPDVYLMGCLIASQGFIGDEARLPVWKQLLAEALMELEVDNRNHNYNGSPLVMMGGSRP